jgi:uncharacterized protein YdeI (YjbR/CyaY-like superfamily)
MKIIGVDDYLRDGCGRCNLYASPACKVHKWTAELRILRELVLECGLIEELKWGVPCYTYNKANVCVISAFKDYASLSFFKGALLDDKTGILQKPGEHSQASRVARFTEPKQIVDAYKELKILIFQAVEVEKLGLKINFEQKNNLVYPEELLLVFETDEEFRIAFETLTPGRKRSHLLNYSSAKQAKTRVSRIEKSRPVVLAGKGWNEY